MNRTYEEWKCPSCGDVHVSDVTGWSLADIKDKEKYESEDIGKYFWDEVQKYEWNYKDGLVCLIDINEGEGMEVTLFTKKQMEDSELEYEDVSVTAPKLEDGKVYLMEFWPSLEHKDKEAHCYIVQGPKDIIDYLNGKTENLTEIPYLYD